MSEKSAPSYQEQWMIGSNLNHDDDDDDDHYDDIDVDDDDYENDIVKEANGGG